jgi:uncharacterized membrane protein
METNKKREAVIYICFLICVVITVLVLPLYSITLSESTKKIYYDNYKLSIDSLLQFFALLIIVLICSMIIVSIFI